MNILTVETEPPYNIYIGENILNQGFADFCKPLANRFVMIADDNVLHLYAEPLITLFIKNNLKITLIPIKASEENKTRETKENIENELLSQGFSRDTCILALGGGIVIDIAGFVAATFCRGIPHVNIPTSLLAMVDASIGGKTGVNAPQGKNLIGAIKQPAAVFIDIDALKTLAQAEFNNGLVEIIKHALLADEALFKTIEKDLNSLDILEVISRSCDIKQNVIEMDVHEVGIRQILNFGHTVGHAIETVSNYKIPHGQAVAYGILAEGFISMQLNILSESDFKKIEGLFARIQFDATFNEFNFEKIKEAMTLDKKSKNNIPHFVILQEIGIPYLDKGYTMPVSEDIINQALEYICC